MGNDIVINNNMYVFLQKKDNMFVMEYCSDPRIFSKEYRLISSK